MKFNLTIVISIFIAVSLVVLGFTLTLRNNEADFIEVDVED